MHPAVEVGVEDAQPHWGKPPRSAISRPGSRRQDCPSTQKRAAAVAPRERAETPVRGRWRASLPMGRGARRSPDGHVPEEHSNEQNQTMETEHARAAETRPPRTLFPFTWLTAQCKFSPRGGAPSVFTTGHAQTAGHLGSHASVLCTLQGRLADKKRRASLLHFEAERKVPPQVYSGVSHNPRSGEFIKGREGRRPTATGSSERSSSRAVPRRRRSCDGGKKEPTWSSFEGGTHL